MLAVCCLPFGHAGSHRFEPAQPAATGEGCPDGVENCPGDCTGNERNERDMKSITPYPTGHECPECGRVEHDVACPRTP